MTTEEPLGETNVVKHTIETSGSPIRQALSRLDGVIMVVREVEVTMGAIIVVREMEVTMGVIMVVREVEVTIGALGIVMVVRKRNLVWWAATTQETILHYKLHSPAMKIFTARR